MEKLIAFLKIESGASAVEYGLIVALIACAIVATLTAFGQNVNQALYQKVADNLS